MHTTRTGFGKANGPRRARRTARPYPRQYVTAWKTRDAVPVTIRPIRPDDEPLMVRFHQALSFETVHARYFGFLKLSERTAHERLARLCFIDYDRVMALVVEHDDPVSGKAEIVAVGRLIKADGGDEAEFALLVADGWQRRGLGGELLRLLVGVGRDEGLARVRGDILASNAGMLRVSKRAGFTLRRQPGTDTIEATMRLQPVEEPRWDAGAERSVGPGLNVVEPAGVGG